MIYASTGVLVPYSSTGIYDPKYTFRLPDGLTAEKLTVVTRDGDVVVQMREGDAFPDDYNITEQRVDQGFTSLVFVTPITGWRLRAFAVGVPTLVSFHAYG